MLRVTLANQVSAGELRYTLDGSVPTPTSSRYVHPLDVRTQDAVTLRAATFGADGSVLAAPRARRLDPASLHRRDADTLDSCSKRPAMRLDGVQPPQGPRPVYKIYVGDMCWLSRGAPPGPLQKVSLTVERLAWRFGDEAKDAVTRPKSTADGDFEVHAGTCTGPLVARLPVPHADHSGGQHELQASVLTTRPTDARTVCIFATGDPREGLWALAQVAFTE